MSKTFDFIVVGGGSAGYAGARTAHEAGARVAVVDGATELGGLCILRGCMPSKTLLYSAEVLHLAQRATLFGLAIPAARADRPAPPPPRPPTPSPHTPPPPAPTPPPSTPANSASPPNSPPTASTNFSPTAST